MNKTFLLVAQIFAFIAAGLFILYGLMFMFIFGIISSMSSDPIPEAGFITTVGFVLLLFGILDIVAALRLGAAKANPDLKGEALGWSIYLLFGAGLIAGIFGIIGVNSSETSSDTPAVTSIEQKLKDLDNLFDKGIISREEYDTRRKKIIESI